MTKDDITPGPNGEPPRFTRVLGKLCSRCKSPLWTDGKVWECTTLHGDGEWCDYRGYALRGEKVWVEFKGTCPAPGGPGQAKLTYGGP